MLDAAAILDDLRIPPANRLEALRGNRKGQHSIRINNQWRICFRWKGGNAYDVEIVDRAPNFGDYPRDFIVIDECHRGGANDESTWRAILDYFALAVQLGLTATPKRKVNADTYVYTSDDTIIEGELEAGRRYEEEDFNRIIEIEARERYRVQTFLGMIDQREKSLVFCANQEHAAAVRDLINQEKKSKDPNYCVRVTANDGARGEAYLRQFQDNENHPHHIAEALHRRRCAQRAQHCADAPGQLDDRVQADHRPWHPPV